MIIVPSASTAESKTSCRQLRLRRGVPLPAGNTNPSGLHWACGGDPTARYRDLGPDCDTSRVVTERKIRNHIAQLTAMGYRVTLDSAA